VRPTRSTQLTIDADGGLVRLRAHCDPDLVERLKRLPGRRYIAERAEWVLPARRDGLVAIARLVIELDGQVELSERARRRLDRYGPGRLELCEGEFELCIAPRPGRLARIRAIPERRYVAERRVWRVPPTRAGALALIPLLEDGELVATPAAASLLPRLAATRPVPNAEAAYEPAAGPAEGRASPSPHWRHVTRGPVFRANAHEWVEGIGWCVRVRVDPRRRGTARGT
jgi:hypothetical protein